MCVSVRVCEELLRSANTFTRFGGEEQLLVYVVLHAVLHAVLSLDRP